MRFTAYTTASAMAALAAAQTFTDCNPMEKKCPNNPAVPQTWETDFTAGKDAIKGWKQTAGSLEYGPEGAEFIVAKKGDAPTIGSEAFLHFGYVEVVMKAAPGQGIVSSIVLQSDNLDEVDWEWIGGVDSRVQQNYFGKGNTTTYDRMIEADAVNNQNEFHKYALNWTAEALTWIIDDVPTRTLNFADANGGKTYPQTPCNVRLGNWPGGDSKDKGTIEWAGGKTTYEDAPYKMTVKSVKVINYSPGTEYEWTDKTGDFGSIKVIDAGNKEGAPQNTAVLEPSATGTVAPIESGVDIPSATGAPSNGTVPKPESPAASTTCTEEGAVETPAVPAGGNDKSDFNYPTGGAAVPQESGSPETPSDSQGTPSEDSEGDSSSDSEDDSSSESEEGSEEAPCECGTAYVTVTGAPPAIFTSEYSAVLPSNLPSSLQTVVSDAPETPLASSAQVPIVTAVPPPYPTTTGLAIDTAPAPGIPAPSGGTGVLPQPSQPSASASFSAPPSEFTGAASQMKAGALVGIVAGAVLLAF